VIGLRRKSKYKPALHSKKEEEVLPSQIKIVPDTPFSGLEPDYPINYNQADFVLFLLFCV